MTKWVKRTKDKISWVSLNIRKTMKMYQWISSVVLKVYDHQNYRKCTVIFVSSQLREQLEPFPVKTKTKTKEERNQKQKSVLVQFCFTVLCHWGMKTWESVKCEFNLYLWQVRVCSRYMKNTCNFLSQITSQLIEKLEQMKKWLKEEHLHMFRRSVSGAGQDDCMPLQEPVCCSKDQVRTCCLILICIPQLDISIWPVQSSQDPSSQVAFRQTPGQTARFLTVIHNPTERRGGWDGRVEEWGLKFFSTLFYRSTHYFPNQTFYYCN